MTASFEGFDFVSFWDYSEYALREFVCEPVSDELIDQVEQQLGYKLPAAYLELMRDQNGGVPAKTVFPLSESAAPDDDFVMIDGILGISRSKSCSLTGEAGSRFWVQEWEYPDIGIYFGFCPSGGHEMICMDYRACGPDGEPQIVYIDQEADFAEKVLAQNFELFIKGLVDESSYFDED